MVGVAVDAVAGKQGAGLLRTLPLPFARDGRVMLQAVVPLGQSGDDVGFARDPLPPRARHKAREARTRRAMARLLTYGRAREQRHHVIATEVAVGEEQEGEQRARRHGVGETVRRRAVHRNTAGGKQFMEEQRVRLALRVADGDPVQSGPRFERGEQIARDGPYFFVGVGAADDALGTDTSGRRGVTAHTTESSFEGARHGQGRAVGALLTRHGEDCPYAVDARERGDEVDRRGRERPRTKQHNRPEIAHRRVVVPDERRRGTQLVLVVVVRRGEVAVTTEARDHRRGTSAGGREALERRFGRRGELTERGGKRSSRDRVVGGGTERRGGAGQRRPHRARPDRRRERTAVGLGEERRPEQFGDAPQGHEPDAHQAVRGGAALAASGRPAQGESGVGRRRRDRHRGQRVAGLELAEVLPERRPRRFAVGDQRERSHLRHRPQATDGV